LRHAELRPKARGFLHEGEILGGQSLQREAALAAFEDEFVLARFQRDGLVRRHGAQDVDELARANGGAEVAAVAIELGLCADLDLQIAGGELQLRPCFANEDIGEDGQGMAPFHNASNRLQGRQNFFLSCFQNDHVILLIFIKKWLDSR